MIQAFIKRSLEAEESLWWSPNIVGGYPVMADPLAAFFYPPNFLMHLLMPRELLPYLAMELQATLHFLWAAIGMFLLARLLTGSRAGALVAALAWAFGSYFVWHLPHLSPISTLSWLPWILFAYANAVRQRSLLWIAAAAMATGFMMLAGHAMTILQITYVLIGISLVLVWQHWGTTWREAMAPLRYAVAIIVLGAGLAAVQLLPAWHLSAQSERANFGLSAAADSSFAPYWAITALLPNFFSVFDPGEYWAAGDPAETNLYMGLLPLLLAGIGLVGARSADRRAIFLILGGAIVAMLLAFGVFAWPFQIAYDLLPGFDRVRRPVTFIAFAQFAVALLAAYGLKALVDHDNGHDHWQSLSRWTGLASLVAFGIAVVVGIIMVTTIGTPTQQQLIAILSGTVLAGVLLMAIFAVTKAKQHLLLSARSAMIAFVLLLAIDLGSAHKAATYRNEEMPPNVYIGLDWVNHPDNELIPMLQDETGAGSTDRYRVLPDGTASVWANGSFVWGLESAAGYIVLCPVQYCDLLDAARSNPESPAFDLLNIRYLVTDYELEERFDDGAAEKFELIYDEGPRVYENSDVLPRAWIAHQSVYREEQQVLSYLLDNTDDLAGSVVISDPAAPVVSGVPDNAGSVEIVSYENTSVRVNVSMPSEGYLVLADSYFPGWGATVNGDTAEIYRANHAFRAVHLPAGEHEVEMSYRQSWLYEGAVISAIALVAVLAIGGFGLVSTVRRRRSLVGDPDNA